MKKLLSVFLVCLLLLPIQATAANQSLWEQARDGQSGGTIGGLTIPISNNSSVKSVHSDVSNLPQIIEIYTATWCTNCVTTESIVNEITGDSNVKMINYHRYKYEVRDPFGSQQTDNRWETVYGESSVRISSEYGLSSSRIAPTIVFDGERLHLGTTTKSSSLKTDYSASMAVQSSNEFRGEIYFSMDDNSVHNNNSRKFFWDTSNLNIQCFENCHLVETGQSNDTIINQKSTLKISPWIMIIEESINYPAGANGKGNYSNVLHEAFELTNLSGNTSIQLPNTWDGDDLMAVLILDWSSEEIISENNQILPFPSIYIYLSILLASVIPKRRK